MKRPAQQPIPTLLSLMVEREYPPTPDSHLPKLEAIDSLWRKGVKVPVETLCDLARLDSGDIVDGYLDGMKPDPLEPGNNRSRAYWHGWRNARIDRAPDTNDHAATELARREFWWASRDAWGVAIPDRYKDLERAFERGEPV